MLFCAPSEVVQRINRQPLRYLRSFVAKESSFLCPSAADAFPPGDAHGSGLRYLMSTTSFPCSLYTRSSTNRWASKTPNPPGRIPFTSRYSAWRNGSSSGLAIAAWGISSSVNPSPGSVMWHATIWQTRR